MLNRTTTSQNSNDQHKLKSLIEMSTGQSSTYPTEAGDVNQRQAGLEDGKHTEAERILSVLAKIKEEGLKGIGNFIVLALSSEDQRVKSHISPIYQSKGKVFNILEILLNACVIQRRRTGKYVKVLRDKLGDTLKSIFEEMVDLELKDVMENKEIHRSPSSLNTDIASEFAFGNFQNIFVEKAPFTWGVLCWLCGLNQKETPLEDDEDEDDEEVEGGADGDGCGSGEEGDVENDGELGGDHQMTEGRKIRVMDRYLRATTLFGIIMNSRNVKVNYFQTMVRDYCPTLAMH